MSDTYYRYDYQPSEYSYGEGELYIREFVVVKHTAKGAWIISKLGYSKKRFVLNSGRKRFAYQCKTQALESFIARKKRSIAINQYNIDIAREALVLAEAQPARGSV